MESCEGRYKFLIYFVMLYLTLDLASNVVGYRETSVGAFIIPGSTFIYPLNLYIVRHYYRGVYV